MRHSLLANNKMKYAVIIYRRMFFTVDRHSETVVFALFAQTS